MNPTCKSITLIVALSLALSACNDKKPAAMPDKVALKVNGQGIAAYELSIKSGSADAPETQAVSEQMMKRFVDLELLRQAAVQAKLDQDAAVRAKIAIATRTILATAYMEKQLAAVAKPSATDIETFYKQNPARFAERSEYGIQEFTIRDAGPKLQEIQAQLAKVKTPQAFGQWLKEQQIAHTDSPVRVTSERLPDDLLSKLGNVPVGGSLALSEKDQINVLFVVSKKPAPLALPQVEPMIANMLLEKSKGEALETATKQLRDKAKIEYLAPYTAGGYTPSSDENKP